MHVWFLFSLQRGGYPFKADDLSIEEWVDIGTIADLMDAHKRGLTIGK